MRHSIEDRLGKTIEQPQTTVALAQRSFISRIFTIHNLIAERGQQRLELHLVELIHQFLPLPAVHVLLTGSVQAHSGLLAQSDDVSIKREDHGVQGNIYPFVSGRFDNVPGPLLFSCCFPI